MTAVRGGLRTIALLLALVSGAEAHDSLPLVARPLALNPEDPAQLRIGQLTWRGGLEITSPDRRFGGLSALLVTADGARMTALTDQGKLIAGRLTYDDAGRLAGLDQARITTLRGLDGRPLADKRRGDAEALSRAADGALLVAFERAHRIWRYPADLDRRDGRPRLLGAPPGLRRAPRNKGIEAMTELADGGLLAITEGLETVGGIAAYLRQGETWSRLTYRRRGDFRPSGAARLPDGDVVVVERKFSVLGGLTARVLRLPTDAIRPNAVLAGEEIAVFGAPVLRDNFEGIAARRGESGETLIYLVSDDNFNAWQRTLLLMFALEPEPPG